ncbi:MAG: tetratricopeptide repeat protein [Nitrososphaeraceae archaeon]|nr:tetratricopeptide repeat protein [Nitrososphaeraceae archaeon]
MSKLFNQSLEIAKQIGDKYGIGRTLNNIAKIRDNKGEYNQAMDLYNESLGITRKIGDQEVIAGTLNNIAVVLIEKEKYEESLFHVLQAYRILERLGIPSELQKSVDIWVILKVS